MRVGMGILMHHSLVGVSIRTTILEGPFSDKYTGSLEMFMPFDSEMHFEGLVLRR